MSGDLFWKNLCFIRDGAADVVAEAVLRRLIDGGFVTLDRRLTEKGLARLAKGDAAWRASPSIVPEIRAWRAEVKA